MSAVEDNEPDAALVRPPDLKERRRRIRTAVIAASTVAVLLVVAVVLLSTVGLGGSGDGGAGAPATTAAGTPAPTTAGAPGDCAWTPTSEWPTARPAPLPTATSVADAGTVAISLQTDQGPIPMTLDRSIAPCAVENFLHLTNVGFFDDIPCHRLTTSPQLKVLQCGDPTDAGNGGPGYTIPDEPPSHLAPAPADAGLAVYPRGTVGMAKPQAPDSGGSQFFLVYADSTIAPEYAVLGTIAPEGLATVDAIARAGTNHATRLHDGRPRTPVTIRSVTIG